MASAQLVLGAALRVKAALKEGGSEGAALIRFRGGTHKAVAASQKPDLKADLRGYFGFFEQHAIEVGGV